MTEAEDHRLWHRDVPTLSDPFLWAETERIRLALAREIMRVPQRWLRRGPSEDDVLSVARWLQERLDTLTNERQARLGRAASPP